MLSDFEEAFEAIDGRHGVLTDALLRGLDPARQTDGRVTNLTLATDVNRCLAGETQHPLCANSGEPILLTWRAVAAAVQAPATGRCPYKGLRYFEPDDGRRGTRRRPPHPHHYAARRLLRQVRRAGVSPTTASKRAWQAP